LEFKMSTKLDHPMLRLRDHAVELAKSKGRVVERDGAHLLAYAGDHIEIELTPPLMGASNPHMLDVWAISDRPRIKVLSMLWNDARVEVLAYRPGSWEQRLLGAGVRKAAVRAAVGDGAGVQG
jgi:hypothetical protein